MKPVRMLTSAEGEFSLSAGRVYNLPESLADSFLEAGYAELPEEWEKAEDVQPNVPAEHHADGYVEFLPGAEPTTAEEVADAEAQAQAEAAAANAAAQAEHDAREAAAAAEAGQVPPAEDAAPPATPKRSRPKRS
jgi:hypothetical protein